MTRARNGVAQSAPTGTRLAADGKRYAVDPRHPARMIAWHVIPDDDDRGPSKTFPACRDGDDLLARVGDDVVEVTVERRHGVRFVGLDGEAVDAEAIAERPRNSPLTRPTLTEAQHRARGRVQLKVRITTREREMLQWIQDQDGHDLSTIIGTYIRTEYDERAGERRR